MAILVTSRYTTNVYHSIPHIIYYMSPKHIRKSKTIENSQDFYD